MQEFDVPAANSRIKRCDVTLAYTHKQKGMYFGCGFSSELKFLHNEHFKKFKKSSEWS